MKTQKTVSRVIQFSMAAAICGLLSFPANGQLTLRSSTFEASARSTGGGMDLFSIVGQPEAGPASTDGGVLNLNHGFLFPGDPDFLAVELVSFEVASQGDGSAPLLTWQTAAEINSIGFHIYRAFTSPTGGITVGERLTTQLIPNLGDPTQGAFYEFYDPQAFSFGEGDRSYFLEEIDLSGVKTLYGPARLSDPGRTTSVGDWHLF